VYAPRHHQKAYAAGTHRAKGTSGLCFFWPAPSPRNGTRVPAMALGSRPRATAPAGKTQVHQCLLQARFQSTHLRHFDDRHHSLRLCDVCGAWLALFWVFGRRWFIERDLFPLPPPASVVPGLVRLQLRSHALFGAFLVFLCALLFLLQLPHALERTQDEGQAIGGLECSLSRHRVSLDCGILHRPANSRTPSGHPPCTPHKHSLPAADPSSPPFSPSARVQACFPETSNRSQLSNRPIGCPLFRRGLD